MPKKKVQRWKVKETDKNIRKQVFEKLSELKKLSKKRFSACSHLKTNNWLEKLTNVSELMRTELKKMLTHGVDIKAIRPVSEYRRYNLPTTFHPLAELFITKYFLE